MTGKMTSCRHPILQHLAKYIILNKKGKRQGMNQTKIGHSILKTEQG
jgi:hypothetical protein